MIVFSMLYTNFHLGTISASLLCIKSDLLMLLPARTINKTSPKFFILALFALNHEIVPAIFDKRQKEKVSKMKWDCFGQQIFTNKSENDWRQ